MPGMRFWLHFLFISFEFDPAEDQLSVVVVDSQRVERGEED